MQPAAARVGPSNAPSVRRIAVRFSSGATICIEKTIKVQFFQVVSSRLLPSSSQEAGQRTVRVASVWKVPSKQRDKKFNRPWDNVLRGSSPSEISEETPKSR